MTNQSQITNTPSKNTYDAGDLMDAHALAHHRLSWVGALVNAVRLDEQKGNKGNNKELLEIAEYLCETFADDHDQNRVAYEKEHRGLVHDE